MKQWVKKLLDQFAFDWGSEHLKTETGLKLSEERATLLYFLDVYNKHLLEIEKHPVRKVRETLDGFAKELLKAEPADLEKTLFLLRQFLSSYRVDEYTYIQKNFDDFKKIIWDFADQLSEDIKIEKVMDGDVDGRLTQLREAVESNSVDALRAKSREFIDYYKKHQSQKDDQRAKRLATVRRNLTSVKKKLVEADRNMKVDHLTGAFNRKSFDEQMKAIKHLFDLSKGPSSMILLDIDHFKKVNDCYGHDIGDFVLKECVRTLQECFNREGDFVARIGGEEFAVLMPETAVMEAVKRAEECLSRIRREVYITGKIEIRFTISMGIAQLIDGETTDQWLKRADTALYTSKNSGRDRYTVAPQAAQAA